MGRGGTPTLHRMPPPLLALPWPTLEDPQAWEGSLDSRNGSNLEEPPRGKQRLPLAGLWRVEARAGGQQGAGSWGLPSPPLEP